MHVIVYVYMNVYISVKLRVNQGHLLMYVYIYVRASVYMCVDYVAVYISSVNHSSTSYILIGNGLIKLSQD